MKNLLLATLLFAVSSVASAASISFTNPIAVVDYQTNPVLPTSIISTSDSLNLSFTQGLPVNEAYRIEIDMSVLNAPSTISFDFASSVDEWNVSVISSSGTQVLGTWLQEGQLSPVANLVATLQSNVAYKLIIDGTYLNPLNLDRSLNLSLQNINVSEVPLPAAVWLFGSVLLGGLAVRRKRQKATALQAA